MNLIGVNEGVLDIASEMPEASRKPTFVYLWTTNALL